MKAKNTFSKIFFPSVLVFTFLCGFNMSYVNAQCSVDAGSDVSVFIGYPPLSCVNLTATATGTPPFSYLWSTGDTTQTINVCPTVNTDYWVTITDSTLCSATDSVTVTIVDARCGHDSTKVLVCHIPPGDPLDAHTICISPHAVPAHLAHGDILGACAPPPPPAPCSVNLGNDTSFCSGEQNLLLDAGSGYVSYLWSDSSTAQTFTVTTSGTYWVQVTDSTNCVATDSITVIIFPSPTANAGNDTTVVEPDCASLFGSATGGTPPYSYLWSTGDTTQNITFCNPASVYTVLFTVIDSNGCSGTDTVVVTVMPQIIINLDPNPNAGRMAVITFVLPKSGLANLELYDMNGTRVALLFRDYVQENINYRVDFSSENLPVGVYVVRLADETGIIANTKMVLVR
jgi:hypothetical protein